MIATTVKTTIFEFTQFIKHGKKVRLKEKDAKTLMDYIIRFEDFHIIHETLEGKTTIQKL